MKYIAIACLLLLCAVLGFVYLSSSAAPVGIVIPHHDMVAAVRSAYLEKISTQYQPHTIVLLSPDHFNQGVKPILTTRRDWTTTSGTIEVNKSVVEALGISEQDSAFEREHGVTTLLQSLEENFPDAQIVPIMIGRKATYQDVTDFTANLYRACPDCFVVASVDFSHTNSAHVAALHDELILRELAAANPESLYKKAEVDSPEVLSVLVQWAKLHGAQKFSLFSHTNSGFLTNQFVGEMTTHIIGGYSNGRPTLEKKDQMTLMFGGDVMFARGVAGFHHDAPREAIISGIGERFFWGVDVAMVNLEGVFSPLPIARSDWTAMPPRLRFYPGYALALKQARISTVGMANNHTFDGGDADALYTTNVLQKLGIHTIGYPRSNEASVKTYAQGETRLAIITLATHEQARDAAQLVTEYRDKGFRVIVYVHWGQEYEKVHSAYQAALAERLVDAGAVLVLGSHPHVVQDVSVYKGVPIVYSLGNFLFDQPMPETKLGAVLGVRLDTQGVEMFLLPIETYIKPKVVIEPDYDSYADSWTKPWQHYQTERGTFYFPFTK